MTLLKQVLSDLFKEIGWIVLYGFLAAMTVMTCILVGLSYKHVSGQNYAITRFIAMMFRCFKSRAVTLMFHRHQWMNRHLHIQNPLRAVPLPLWTILKGHSLQKESSEAMLSCPLTGTASTM